MGEVTNQNSPLVNSYSLIGELTGTFLNHELEILSISRNRIIAKGRWDKVGLYFQQRYDLVTLDYNAPIQNNFPFMIIREEAPTEQFEDIKIDDDIKLSGIQLESTGNHRDVIIYDESVDEWRTGEITGQLEYIGTWDPIINQGTRKGFNNQNNVTFSLTLDGTSLFSPRNGQYFIIKNTCKITNLLNTCKDQTEQTPFVEGIFNYNTGDWIIYGDNEWHYINNRGEVLSFNGRSGIIESCPNLSSCAGQYDYNWDMLNKNNSKLENIADIQIPNGSNNGFVIKVVNGVLRLAEDETGLASVSSSDILDGTLVNEDFGADLTPDMFDGLDLSDYLDVRPQNNPEIISGDFSFGNSHIKDVNQLIVNGGLMQSVTLNHF